jgi:hypothetical protein
MEPLCQDAGPALGEIKNTVDNSQHAHEYCAPRQPGVGLMSLACGVYNLSWVSGGAVRLLTHPHRVPLHPAEAKGRVMSASLEDVRRGGRRRGARTAVRRAAA